MNKIVTRITFGFKQSVYNELDISSPNRLNVPISPPSPPI